LGYAFVVITALPFVGLAVLTRQSVCKNGRWSAFWIGAFVGGMVPSILVFAVLASDLEFLWTLWAELKGAARGNPSSRTSQLGYVTGRRNRMDAGPCNLLVPAAGCLVANFG
jgi:hypothetical protein